MADAIAIQLTRAIHRRFAIYLLVVVSIMLSGLFTWLPAMLLHAILR